MALTSITKDFVVKAGLLVEGTGTVTSSTGAVSALQVNGGASIAKNLIVGTTATVYGPASFLGTVNAVGQSTFGALTATVFTATSAHIIGDATIDGSVITTLVTSTSYLTLGAGGTGNNVEIQTNGYATQFLPTGQIRPSGAFIGGTSNSNQVDVTSTGSLLLKGLLNGVQLTSSPDQGTTNYTWNFDTSGNLTNPGRVIVQSTQASTSSNSGALTVAGGAGINGALNVGNTIYANSSTLATIAGAGAVVVTGGEYIGGNLIVASTATNTSTNYSNALYVEGGAWIDKNLTVGGPTTFRDTVTFNVTATYVYSTQTYYTDNLIELHVPPTGVYGQWTQDDGKDIGFRFHYFANSTDTNAALVLADDSKYLEWYGSGAESTSSVFVGSTYGTFKTGNVYLVGTGDASNTITGSLQLVGGAGIGKNLYVGAGVNANTVTARNLANTGSNYVVYADSNGQLQNTTITWNGSGSIINGTITYANTATNLIGGARGSLPYQSSTGTTVMLPIGGETQVLTVAGGVPSWASASGTTVGNASNAVTATNIAYGLANQIPYQQAPGTTIFNAGLTFNGTVFTATNIIANSNNNATSSTGYSGALMVQGGVGISKDLWVGGDVNIGGNLYFKGVGADTITSSTGTFVDVIVTGTGVSLVVTDSASITRNLQVGNILTATTLNVTGQTILGALTATITTVTSLTVLTTASVYGVGYFGPIQSTIGLANPLLVATNSVNGYTQIQIQNTNSGTQASSDFVATANNGNDSSNFIDMGINNSNFSTSTWTISGANDGYLYVDGGNLTLGTDTPGKNVAVHVGGTTASNIVATFNAANTTSTSSSSGAFIVTGGVGISGNTNIGGTLNVAGQSTLNAVTATAVTATSLTVSGQSILNATTATAFTATSINVSGTLNVSGLSTLAALTATSFTATSSNIIGNESVGGTFSVVGQSTLGALTATVFTATSANIIGAETVGGILTVNNTTDSSLPINGSIVTQGGVGVGKSIVAGGSLTVGLTTSSSVVPAIYSNNSIYASYTSGSISTNSQQTLDNYSATTYRTAKYLVQIVDGTKIHVEEILVFHDGTNVYISEYAIASTNGELGSFNATIGSSTITLNFTPNYTPSAMVIKVIRTAITL